MPKQLAGIFKPPKPWHEMTDAEKREWSEKVAGNVKKQTGGK